MSRILKYFSVFLFWLAGLTVSAHLIIPHDHHISVPYSNQDNNCPASGSKSGHKSGFPVHCHAFNDLASEEAKLYHSPRNFQFSSTALSILADPDAYNLPVRCISVFDFQKPIIDSNALELSLLRAPPAIA